MIQTTPQTSPRWVGAACALGLVVLMFSELGYLFAHPPGDPEQAGAVAELAGRFTVWTLGAALVASLTWNRARVMFWAAMVVGVGLQVALLVPQLRHASRSTVPAELTDADRARPVEDRRDGARWLRHAALGFELPIPDDLAFAEDAEIARTLGDHPELAGGMTAWHLQNADGTRVVILSAMLFGTDDPSRREARFASFSQGVRDASQAPNVQVLEDRQDPLDRTIRMVGTANGATATQRVIAYEHEGRFIGVTVAAMSFGGAASLDASATELRHSP